MASLSPRLETGHHSLTPAFHAGVPPARSHLVITQSLFSLSQSCLHTSPLPPSKLSRLWDTGLLHHQANTETRLELFWSTFNTYEALGRWLYPWCLNFPFCTMGMIQ